MTRAEQIQETLKRIDARMAEIVVDVFLIRGKPASFDDQHDQSRLIALEAERDELIAQRRALSAEAARAPKRAPRNA
jgi:hypothetical protein